MKSGKTIRAGVALVAILAAMPALGQRGARGASGNSIQLSLPQTESVTWEVVREIDDPHSGTRWVLKRDSSHPAGPGRLEPVADFEEKIARGEPLAAVRRPVPAIRAGDHLILQEDTAVVEVRLEAVALGAAVVGSPLKVRLKIGGVVVRAVALAPGHAALKQETEVRP